MWMSGVFSENANADWPFTAGALQPGRPYWANFRILGDCLIWAYFLKISEVAHIFGLLFSTDKIVHYFRQKIGWATFWVSFKKANQVTLVSTAIRFREIDEFG
jgi:hypothetical protein